MYYPQPFSPAQGQGGFRGGRGNRGRGHGRGDYVRGRGFQPVPQAAANSAVLPPVTTGSAPVFAGGGRGAERDL